MSDYNPQYRYDDYDRRPPPLSPNVICVGCQYNKMPYCFAPNSNDRRIDMLPPNFMCAVKIVDKKENVIEQESIIKLRDDILKKIDKKLNKILNKMKKWE